MQVAGYFKELGPSPQNAHTNTQFLPYRKELKDHWDCDFRHRSESIRVQGGKRGACHHCYKMNTTGIVPGIDCIVAGFKIFRLLMSQKEAPSIWNHFPIPVCFLLLSLSTDPESIIHSQDFVNKVLAASPAPEQKPAPRFRKGCPYLQAIQYPCCAISFFCNIMLNRERTKSKQQQLPTNSSLPLPVSRARSAVCTKQHLPTNHHFCCLKRPHSPQRQNWSSPHVHLCLHTQMRTPALTGKTHLTTDHVSVKQTIEEIT